MQKALYFLSNGGLKPVITTAVAETEGAREAQLVFVAVVVRTPGELVNLTGSRLHLKTVAVFALAEWLHRSLRVRGANCVTADSPTAAISLDDASQIFGRAVGYLRAICLDGIKLPVHHFHYRFLS